jgi:chromosome segregation ATPase
MTKKSPIVTDERPREAETVQKVSALDIALQQFRNAADTVQRLGDDIHALQDRIREIDDHAEQAKEAAEQAKQTSVAADELYQHYPQQELRARTRATVAQGTPEQAERQADLDEVVNARGEASKAKDEALSAYEAARQAKDEALSRQVDETARCKAEITEKTLLQQEFETVRTEAWARIGDEKARLISERLDEVQQEITEYEQKLRLAQQERNSELAKIRDLKFNHPSHYADLVKRYLPEQHEAERSVSPAERIIESHIAHLKVLSMNGSSLQGMIYKDMMRFCNALDLNPSLIRGFLTDEEYTFKRGRIEVAELLLKQYSQSR